MIDNLYFMKRREEGNGGCDNSQEKNSPMVRTNTADAQALSPNADTPLATSIPPTLYASLLGWASSGFPRSSRQRTVTFARIALGAFTVAMAAVFIYFIVFQTSTGSGSSNDGGGGGGGGGPVDGCYNARGDVFLLFGSLAMGVNRTSEQCKAVLELAATFGFSVAVGMICKQNTTFTYPDLPQSLSFSQNLLRRRQQFSTTISASSTTSTINTTSTTNTSALFVPNSPIQANTSTSTSTPVGFNASIAPSFLTALFCDANTVFAIQIVNPPLSLNQVPSGPLSKLRNMRQFTALNAFYGDSILEHLLGLLQYSKYFKELNMNGFLQYQNVSMRVLNGSIPELPPLLADINSLIDMVYLGNNNLSGPFPFTLSDSMAQV
ncbi:hypothetical protein BC830DRAFT_547641 [Chytriomyces sp. MP71]|nr:hypothetical protein BC830DRAFT_547641 [Chytriomyces sp. MP71]